MKLKKITPLIFAATLLLNSACNSDDRGNVVVQPKGAYENGILIANEGSFGKGNAEVSFVDSQLSSAVNGIYASANSNSKLGDVLQSISFSGGNAYLVMNNSNAIEIVDRYTFKKKAEITANLVQPRYMAFSGNNYYVTNNDFFSTRKVNVYSSDNTFVKSIPFERYAEKIAESGGYVYVQTDGVKYDTAYNEVASGHTVSRINPATNSVDKTITLDDIGIIRDLMSANGTVYVVSTDSANTYFYEIAGASGSITKIIFTGLPSVRKVVADAGQLYFLTSDNKIYAMDAASKAAPTKIFDVAASYVYGFNVIDGRIYIADASFTQNSTVKVYSTTGSLIKTFTTGVGTNGFYKN